MGNLELYLIERPFFNRPYIFITIVMDNADGDYSYIRPDGPYYQALQDKGTDMSAIPKIANHFPPVPIEGETDKKDVIGISVYGHHHPHRHHHGMYGGASWPNTYEEITPVCDGFLVDLKMFYDLDKSWDSESMFLGNAGFKPAQVTNYTVDLNIFGEYTDQYLIDEGKVNPYRMDLTPDNVRIMSSDNAKPIETIQLDFNRAGDYLEFNEVEGLQPEIRKKVITDMPEENLFEEGDPMIYKFAIKNQEGLYSCCSDEDVCTKQSCMKMENDEDTCYYPVTVRRDRSNCGNELVYRTLDMR